MASTHPLDGDGARLHELALHLEVRVARVLELHAARAGADCRRLLESALDAYLDRRFAAPDGGPGST